MAVVHLGRLLGPVGFARTVAIKRLHANYAKDPGFVAMFLDEARLAARIRHPNVVSTLDVVSIDDELFLVMEYVHGESLARLVRSAKARNERVPPRVAVCIVAHTLHGLHAAHEATSERGKPLAIVHRDVSPQNILVGTDGLGRVLDFGIAKATSRLQVTLEGQLKGKLAYMAPEQLEMNDVDRRVDVYSASVVLWEALTGQRLFAGDHPARVMKSVLTREVQRPSWLAEGIPDSLDAIVMKGLARNPDDRFATAREMAIALEATGCASPQHEVGEWVERMALDALCARADAIAEIEGHGTGEHVAHQAISGAISPSVPPQMMADGESREVTSLSGVWRSPRRRRLLQVGVSAAVALAAIGVVWAVTHDGPRVGAPSTSTGSRQAVATESIAGQPPTLSIPAAASPSITAVASSPSSSTSNKVSTASTKSPSPVRPPMKPWGTAATANKDCNPPYTVDKDGVRVPKLHCL